MKSFLDVILGNFTLKYLALGDFPSDFPSTTEDCYVALATCLPET